MANPCLNPYFNGKIHGTSPKTSMKLFIVVFDRRTSFTFFDGAPGFDEFSREIHHDSVVFVGAL